MKKIYMLLNFSLIVILSNAAVLKSVNLSISGTLSSYFSSSEKTTVTDLTLTGLIDSRDFKFMRDELTVLSVLDLSNVTIVAYTGTDGTYSTSSTVYPANTIPDWAFHYPDNTGKTSLTSIKLPTTITAIGSSSFDGTVYLQNVTIPSFVTSLGDAAFWGCSGLTSITIPSTVTTIGISAFSGCWAPITVNSNNPSYSSVDGVLYNKTQTNIIQCPTSKSGNFVIPSTVTSIGQEAFNNCNNLTSVVLPNSITTIGDYAFMFCGSLSNINLSSGLISIGSNAFYFCSSIQYIVFPTTLTTIGAYAFYYCSNLQSVNIPSSVTSIGSAAFLGCWGLFSVDSNNANYSSSYGVLFNKTQTNLIQCPISKTSEMYIPSTVTIITGLAFVGCRCFVSVDINNPNYISENGVLFNKQKTKLLYFPTINSGSYYTIPSTVTTIVNWAFYDARNLSTIIIPSTVLAYGSGAFKQCIGLSSIYVNNKTPVDISSSSDLFYNIFYGVDKINCTLFVPTGSKSLYLAANQWQDFTNIVEFDASAVNSPAQDAINLNYDPATLTLKVEGAQASSQIAVYNLNGEKLLQEVISTGESLALAALPKGMYIVRAIANQKVICKKVIL